MQTGRVGRTVAAGSAVGFISGIGWYVGAHIAGGAEYPIPRTDEAVFAGVVVALLSALLYLTCSVVRWPSQRPMLPPIGAPAVTIVVSCVVQGLSSLAGSLWAHGFAFDKLMGESLGLPAVVLMLFAPGIIATAILARIGTHHTSSLEE